MNDSELQKMIKDAMNEEGLPELDRDLWPRMQARLAAARPAMSMSWVDLLLLAALVVLAAAFPDVVLSMLYHL